MRQRNILSRVKHIMWYSDLEATRFSLALGSLLWAALLFWPGELFTPARTTYAVMAMLAREEVWGALFALQGGVMMYSLLWGYRNRLSFVLDALLGCALWTVSTAACFFAHFHDLNTYQPPAAMSYEVMGALASWWCLVRYTFPKNKKGSANG